MTVRDRAGLFVPMLFFASGFTSLLYQVLWTRQLHILFGVSTIAVTAVVVSCMAGLALGSLAGATLARRIAAPLRWYGLLEIAIGLYGAASIRIVARLDGVSAWLFRIHGESDAIGFLVLIAAAFVLLAAPTCAMGATFPLIVAAERRRSANTSAGYYYAVNTLGAVMGTLLGGFFLVWKFGVQRSLAMNAAVGVAIGCAAILLDHAVRRDEPMAACDASPDTCDSGGAGSLLVLTFAAGFTGLAAEILWTRLFEFKLGSTTYAFTSVLVVLLLGIALGSHIGSRLTKSFDRARLFAALVRLDLYLILATAVALFVFTAVDPPRLHDMLPSSLSDALRLPASYLAAAGLVLLPSMLLSGALFAAGAHAFAGAGHRGHAAGIFYGVNTVGAVAGALSASLFLVGWNAAASIPLVMLVHVPALAMLSAHAIDGSAQRLRVIAAAVFPVVFIALFARPMLVASAWPGKKILLFDEDVAGTITITEEKYPQPAYRKLWLGRDAMTSTSYMAQRYMKMLGHLPALLHPEPKRVLVIALGTGMTLGSFTPYDEIGEIDGVELSRGVIDALPFFDDVNNRARTNPRCRFIHEDGRHFLRASGEDFDIITLEPPPPTNSGAALLYSADFYRDCRAHLRKGGLVAQWFPLHSVSDAEFRMLVATFLASFPHVEAYLPIHRELILIGSAAPIGTARIDERFLRLDGEARRELAELGFVDTADLHAIRLCGKSVLAAYAGGAPVMTDDRPLIDFPELTRAPVDAAALYRLREATETDSAAAAYGYFLDGVLADGAGDKARAAALMNRACAERPGNPFFEYVRWHADQAASAR